ncbi:MAG: DMT family transporter [Candidatus Thorarchaeota archaeon]
MSGIPSKDTGERIESSEALSREHIKSVLIALFVTVLWASSWVIIKFGLEEIPPLTFAGFRYTIAAGILMAVLMGKQDSRSSIRRLTRRDIGVLAGYGTVFVAVTQGAQFVGLDLLDAIAVSLLLNLTPLLVLVIGIIVLKEIPTAKQIGLILIGIGGVLIYFYPMEFESLQLIGILVVLGGVVANAFSSIIGRSINRRRELPPIIVTGISMLIGSLLLLVAGLMVEGVQTIGPLSMVYILWLSIVNTAFAFTLWNKAMQTLRAIDISIINGTMFPQIVLLSVVFLGEMPDIIDWIGLALIGTSVVAVQITEARRKTKIEQSPKDLQ